MKDISLDQIISAVLVTAVIIVVWLLLDRLLKKLPAQNEQRARLYSALKKVLKWLSIALIILNIFSLIPAFKGIIKSLLAGSGILALILSIASQQALSNFISGLIIIFSKPYKVGDLIRYTDTDTLGYVTEIKIRHTVIKTLENTQLIVPNSVINSAAIENYSFNDDRRVCQPLTVDITYESDYNKALVLMTAVIMKNKDYIDVRTEKEKEDGKPPVTVRLRKFSDSSIQLEAWIWARNYPTWLNMRGDLNKAVKQTFDANGIDFAYPHVQLVN